MIAPFTVKAQIKGVICDENQNPVEFANVILMGADSVYIAGTITDVSGKFNFQSDYPKAKLMQITSFGYKTLIKTLDEKNDMGKLMLVSDNILLDEVTITAQRPSQYLTKGGIITTINGSVLSLLGNAMDVIGQLPGVMLEKSEYAVTVV